MPSLDTLILCGGQGRRMGGADKPLLTWEGKPMIEHVADAMPGADHRFISANRNLDQYRRYGEVFTDVEVDEALAHLETPLLGILGALERTVHDWLLVTPGDTPLLKRGWHKPLLDAVDHGAALGAVAHDGHQQHLHLLVHRTGARSLRAYLEGGHRSARGWLEDQEVVPVSIADAEQFTNVNTQADVRSTR